MDESKSLRTLVQKCGVRGIVVKSQASRDLVEALDRLLAGDTFFDPIEKTQPFTGIHGKEVRVIGINGEILTGSKKPGLT
jgi:DNA-binding NarL/FixJ family response regulator